MFVLILQITVYLSYRKHEKKTNNQNQKKFQDAWLLAQKATRSATMLGELNAESCTFPSESSDLRPAMNATGRIYFANTCYVFKQPSAIPCIPQQGPGPGSILNIRTKAYNLVQDPIASRQHPILAVACC